MSEDDGSEVIEWNPFDYVEEDREVLERLAAQRRKDAEFPAHLLTSDPAVVRAIIQASKAQAAADAVKDYSVPPCELPARPAEPGEWPGAAKTLLKKLDGWKTQALYMRGPVISSQNRERTIKNAFVIKANHAAGRAIRVVFHQNDDGKWTRHRDWLHTPEHFVPWVQAASVAALNAYVEETPQPIPLEEA